MRLMEKLSIPAKAADHQQVQLPVLHDGVHGGHYSGEMRLPAFLLPGVE